MRADAALTLDQLYAQAAEVTARESRSFHFATRFFPPEMARGAYAVYWFCRHTDDLVDECASQEEAQANLDSWNSEFEHAVNAGDSDHPVMRVFLDAVRRYDIPIDYARELIRGMRMDAEGVRYDTYGDLKVFCYRVASVVGLMMCHVIGWADPHRQAIEQAVWLGQAMQLTNIVRDVGEDLDRGRVYLPAEDLARVGYSIEQLYARERSKAFRELMRLQIDRARELYRAAEPGIALLDRRGRFAVKVASDVYRQILNRVEALDYDVFSQRAVVSKRAKYYITGRNLIGPVLRIAAARVTSKAGGAR